MPSGSAFIDCKVCNEKKLGSKNSTTCYDCIDAGYKHCSKCNTTKPLSEFYIATDTGIARGICKECCKSNANIAHQVKVKTDKNYKALCNERSKLSHARSYATPIGYVKAIVQRQKRRNICGEYTPEEWFACIEAFNYECAYCSSKHKLTVDHIVAISRGGYGYAFNLVPACESCNKSKGAKDIVEWYTAQPFYAEDKLVKIHKRYRLLQDKLIQQLRR